MIHCFPVKAKYLKLIADGSKRAEAHIYRRFFRRIKPGDILILFDGSANIARALVRSVRFYETMEELLEREEIERILPGRSKQDFINEFCAIYGLKREEMLKKPMIVIEFELIDYIGSPEGKSVDNKFRAGAGTDKVQEEEGGCREEGNH